MPILIKAWPTKVISQLKNPFDLWQEKSSPLTSLLVHVLKTNIYRKVVTIWVFKDVNQENS